MTKVPLAVVSSSIAVELAPILQKAGLNGSIRVVVTGDQVTRHKPDPEPYNLAVSRLKELDPFITASTCLVFEDSKAGIAAATAAGMRVSGVEHPSNLPAQIRREAAALLNNSSL